MLKSELLPSIWKLKAARTCVGALCMAVVLLTPAFGQDFSLTMAAFPPPAAIEPGGTTASNLTIGALNGFSGTVDLSCQVTIASSGQSVTTPACQVSTQSVTPPATAVATITTSNTVATNPGLYTVTVTGTASGTTDTHSAQQNLTVLAVTPNFTITVSQQVQPANVHAGSGGQGKILVNPLNGYSGSVTLACATVTPLVVFPPTCSFTYPAGQSSLQVNGVPVTATISITTIGPVPRASLIPAGRWYAIWLSLPMLMVGGVLLGGKRSRRAWTLLALFVIGGAILLSPACATSSTNSGGTTTINNTNQITPKNGYTFTVVGVDASGVQSSNTASAPTVTLTVN